MLERKIMKYQKYYNLIKEQSELYDKSQNAQLVKHGNIIYCQ